jgi:hypothetical protein
MKPTRYGHSRGGRRAGAAGPIAASATRSAGSNPAPGRRPPRPVLALLGILGCFALGWVVVIGGVWLVVWSATQGAFG